MSLSEAERDALEQLQEAIENGDLFLLRKLLNQTDLTNYPFAGPEDRTLLHVACSLGERECVVELLKAGADPNAVDDNGSTPRSSGGRRAGLKFRARGAPISEMPRLRSFRSMEPEVSLFSTFVSTSPACQPLVFWRLIPSIGDVSFTLQTAESR